MKILKYIIWSLMLTVVFTACQEEDPLDINPLLNQNFVYFDESNATVLSEAAVTSFTADGQGASSDNQLFIQLNRSGADASNELTVNIDKSVEFVSDTDFADAGDDASATVSFDFGDQVVIPAGEYSTTLGIFSKDDLLSSGDKIVELTITGTSDATFEIGLPNFSTDSLGEVQSEDEARLVTETIIIADDDCPIDLPGDWVGTYSLSEEFTAGINDGFSFGFATIVQLDFNPNNPTGTGAFLSQASSSPAGEDFFVENTPLIFNTCPQTLSIANPLTLAFSVSGATALYSISSATFNPAGNVLTFVGDLQNTGGSNFGEYTMVLTKE